MESGPLFSLQLFLDTRVNLSVNPVELLEAQRVLRDRILRKSTLPMAQQWRDLAAEMLLYLDDPQVCWRTCLERLMAVTGADRIDVGYSSSRDASYRPSMEAVRADLVMSSVVGKVMNARDPAIATVWASPQLVVFADVQADARIGADMRAVLLSIGTRRKLAVALRDAGQDVGLLCVDAGPTPGPWTGKDCENLDVVAREVIGPIFNASRRMGLWAHRGEQPAQVRQVLTPAELRVARLVVTGCSYKELARCLGRSSSTIDHQLRSLRLKLGVNSNARLVRELMGLLPTLEGASGRVTSPQASIDRGP